MAQQEIATLGGCFWCLEAVLEVFFAIHDPTSRDQQGNDAGPQYRSAISYHSEAQRQTAEAMIRELDEEKIWPGPIVTEARPDPAQPYCAFVVAPTKFRRKVAAKMRRA